MYIYVIGEKLFYGTGGRVMFLSHVNASCHMGMQEEAVLWHIWMSRYIYDQEEAVLWMSHVTWECVMLHMNAS